MLAQARKAIDYLKSLGVTYADIRVHERDLAEDLCVLDGKLKTSTKESLFGYGIRVLLDGAWGFASSEDLSAILSCAKLARENALSSSKLLRKKVTLTQRPSCVAEFISPRNTNPLNVSLKDKVDLLLSLERKLQHSKFSHTQVTAFFHERHIVFIDTEGSEIFRNILDLDARLLCMGQDRDAVNRERSFNLYLDPSGTRGLDDLQSFRFDQCERIKEDLLEILSAPLCPKMSCDVILLPEMMALQTHETIGHAFELDRILGYELSYAGGSHISLESLKRPQFASEKLTARADATVKNSPGSTGFDDDGVVAQNVVLVDKGRAVGTISSRQSAAEAGLGSSSSALRAQSYNKVPIDRMTNINVDFGSDGTLEDFVLKCEKGVILEAPTSWSIGPNRENFHFVCEYGMLIENGKRKGLVRDASYRGDSVKFWNSLNLVGDKSTWQMQQVFNCGKGQPNQIMRLGHGVPLTLFKDVEVGQ